MKTFKFTVAKFFAGESDGTGAIDIDWPSVHRQAGLDHIQWLKRQKPTECQLIVEKRKNDLHSYLVAEIYCDKLASMYGIMWAK